MYQYSTQGNETLYQMYAQHQPFTYIPLDTGILAHMIVM